MSTLAGQKGRSGASRARSCGSSSSEAVGYATARVKAHAARFRRLDSELSAGRVDEGWLADIEKRDNLFPDVDYHIYQ